MDMGVILMPMETIMMENGLKVKEMEKERLISENIIKDMKGKYVKDIGKALGNYFLKTKMNLWVNLNLIILMG